MRFPLHSLLALSVGPALALAQDVPEADLAAARERQVQESTRIDRNEAVSSEIGAALKRLDHKFVVGEVPIDDAWADAVLADDAPLTFTPAPAKPARRHVTGPEAAQFVLEDFETPAPESLEDADRTERIEALASVFDNLEAMLGGRPTRPGEVKIKQAVPDPDEPGAYDVKVRARHLRVTEAGATVVESTWRQRWRVGADDVLTLVDWRPSIDRRSQLTAPLADSGFADVAGWTFTGRAAGTLGLSIPDLRDVLDAGLGVGILGHHGVAIADVNSDGIDDVYLCQPGGVPNQLWIRRADGTAVEAAAAGGLDLIDATTSALFVDLDGDGDRDVVFGLADGVRIFARTDDGYEESGRFDRIAVTSIAAGDVDRDGLIDLYACAYANPYEGTAFPVPYHAAENGQPNLFLYNVTAKPDRLTFVDATAQTGLDVGAARFSFAATFEDYDDDGDLDLYVANDFGRNSLYVNTGAGSFVDRAPALGVEDIAAGMSAAFADVDGDAVVDLYVSNMESSAGQRVTALDGFHRTTSEDERALLKRHAKGNTLYLGDGKGGLRETSIATRGQWAWGAIPIDLDADGRQDLYVPNGFITGWNQERPDL